jgi:hypothetical protein
MAKRVEIVRTCDGDHDREVGSKYTVWVRVDYAEGELDFCEECYRGNNYTLPVLENLIWDRGQPLPTGHRCRLCSREYRSEDSLGRHRREVHGLRADWETPL